MKANYHVIIMYEEKASSESFLILAVYQEGLFNGGFLHLLKLPVHIVFALPVLSVSLNEVKCLRHTSKLPCTGSVFL